ncbi:hypothetical protein EJ06DRAFT_530013 [Trichodelitschia bisporula]|uniref:Uncharacterized protein n=1 Tax=Trichodelitschia bisporula TaxID=703511 RepID=A0A6G1HYA7_9PEZI|nr:hypothetical protein EJ06DRAFT_530013 [Trichodelitschia bisporula]
MKTRHHKADGPQPESPRKPKRAGQAQYNGGYRPHHTTPRSPNPIPVFRVNTVPQPSSKPPEVPSPQPQTQHTRTTY